MNCLRQRGITLVEALIASVVMGAGLLALLQAHLRFHAPAEQARQRAQALQLAQRDLESLRGTGEPAQEADATDGVFTLQRRVRDLAGGLQAVRLEVAWSDRGGQAHALALHALVAAPDPSFSGALALAEPAVTLRAPTRRGGDDGAP
ncbi:prepilin-type N-terminal cleavage/methylation domain-containing protein [uncultured Azohydromonas sp.]|jgi:Tfp pilus assembly protein PilV|uniref:type IV pilus modification PilV family protein n=1 Tax=uncultured Azohydromonas sp. TaxID=487342 RepID=UPI00262AE626|nr:prepilin-type N-terminal cleavage/methylation domain-containing protein [uncultured Azohydromonas sp.]